MKIILLKDVKKLGEAWEVKEVAKGYARNFLIPRNLAVLATKNVLKKAKLEQKFKTEKKKKAKDAVKKVAKDLGKLTISFSAKATKAGALFASITKRKIAQEIIKTTKITKLDSKKVQLDKPIKKVGNYKVKVKLEPKLESEVKVKVTGVSTGKGKSQKSKGKKK
ncbi:50S ribosomal protein L9 [Patescibacteria group bacterium]